MNKGCFIMCFAFRMTQARLCVLMFLASLLAVAGPLNAQQSSVPPDAGVQPETSQPLTALQEAAERQVPPDTQPAQAVPTLLTLELATEILLHSNPTILAARQEVVAERGVEVSQSELLETVRVVKFDLQRRHYDVVLARV